MRNYRNLCALLICLAFPACADNSETSKQVETKPTKTPAESPGNPPTSSSRQLPQNWEKLTHAEWLNTLDINSCEARNQGSESRRKNWVELGERSKLLLLTCSFGAYQDAFHVFFIDTQDKTINRVVLKTPTKEGKAQENKIVRGSLYKSEQGKSFELLHLSAATGACGWRAVYSIKAIKTDVPIGWQTLFGDDDCYNGVTVDDWPVIK